MRRARAMLILVALLGAACDRPAAPPSAPAPEQHKTTELRRLLASPRAPTLIDLRARAAYEAFHIPGARRQRVHELPHLAATKVGEVVLVTDDGRADDRLCDVLKTLRADGRDVRLLAGGMAAWCASGGETTAPCRDLPSLTASPAAPARGRTLVSPGQIDGGARPAFVAPKEDCGCL